MRVKCIEDEEISFDLAVEDISIEGLLTGKPSGESQTPFKKGLANR